MADLIIRGMEMPKEGEKILIAADGSVWVNAWPTRGYMRMENAHAIPLQEWHGRLIDADAISESLAESATLKYNKRTYVTLADAFESMVDMLKEADTIVPAEGGTENG